MQLTWLIGKQLLEASKRIDDWLIRFEGDSTLIVECLWRLVDTTQIIVASLDQGQRSTVWVNRTGNEEIAIVFRDVGQELSRLLHNARIHSAIVRPITNDVQIDFDNGMSLQLVSDRSSCGGWCIQSPNINLVATGSQLALHTKQAELANDAHSDGPDSPSG